MKVDLLHVGKKFRTNWIFRNIDYSFESGGKYAILGPNGSGKSTLLQIISGVMLSTEGKVQYSLNGREVPEEKVYSHISIAAPYMSLFEKLTLKEHLDLHIRFRKVLVDGGVRGLAECMELDKHLEKRIEDFSSGMKQRLRLALAFLSEGDLILLDEPTSNLDESGRKWYHKMVNEYLGSRTAIVCSNKQQEEYNFCTEVLSL